MKPVLALFLRKELRDIRSNAQVWIGYLILPLIGVGIPLVFLAVVPLDSTTPGMDPDFVTLFRFATLDPALAAYPEGERVIRLLMREVGVFFLFMPVILSSMGAAMSIAADKQQRTLEPILATPVEDREFLLAKLLAAAVPGTLVTWAAGLLFALGATIVSTLRLGHAAYPGIPFAVALVLLVPLAGGIAALIGMRASMRAADVQAAAQMAGLWVIPAAIVLIGLVGRPALRNPLLALIALVVFGLVFWRLFVGTLKRFDREEILVRWRR
ncbi:MAG: ABC transporter permease subunit [Gemmatimonadales bacterium]